ncbi:helix-turn-helix domain-containing protein [Dyadobacter sp. CY345]|uniref:helix-turn-helix domain-containing protein n=1 Tax=Dyadobacter sp. CY345 TaxID=2909335 RepID=UPI001F2BAEF5|nr:helix-turn-helix domain-containing protein [Dyadobacter sp. CY345]MCF2443627.1 helix-turn-helix domain-containing protein [Dyadobacter sp. CY345]
MECNNSNATLEDMAFQLLKLREENFIIKAGIQKLLEISTTNEPRHLPAPLPLDIERFEVYLNSTEVQRILNVTAPVIYDWIRDGLLSTRDSDTKITNRFLLSEIEWLKKQNFRRLNTNDIRALIKKKSLEYRRI